MKLSIYRLHKNIETFDVASLITVPTVQGIIGFLPNHMEFISELSPGEIEVISHGLKHTIKIEKGYVNFKDNECKIFVME